MARFPRPRGHQQEAHEAKPPGARPAVTEPGAEPSPPRLHVRVSWVFLNVWPGDSGLPGLRCGLALWASGFPDESVVARTEARFPPRAATSQKHPASWAQRPRPPAPPRPRPSEAQRRCRAPASPPGEPGSEMPHRLPAFPQTAARGQATPGEASRAWRPVRGRLHLGVPRGPKARAVFAQGGSLRAAGHRASPPAEPQIPCSRCSPVSILCQPWL